MNTLYWDAFAGISGDMALASLIDLGIDMDKFLYHLNSLPLEGFELKIKTVQIQGICATDVDVVITKESTHHRHLTDIEEILRGGKLTDGALERSLKVFSTLAQAEAAVHGTTLDKIHFHEVGAVDSIVDITGTCIALDLLNIDNIFVSDLPWSKGSVRCAHGILPLPAPASVQLLSGFVFQDSGISGELITPTGAAFLKTFARQEGFPKMKIEKVGYGAGKFYHGLPNMLRAVLGTSEGIAL